MPKAKKHDAGQPPLPQQRDERGGLRDTAEQPLGSERFERRREPKLPHERDETTGSESTGGETTEGNRELMRKAADDLASGRQDTDRGPVADQTYHELRKNKK